MKTIYAREVKGELHSIQVLDEVDINNMTKEQKEYFGVVENE